MDNKDIVNEMIDAVLDATLLHNKPKNNDNQMKADSINYCLHECFVALNNLADALKEKKEAS